MVFASESQWQHHSFMSNRIPQREPIAQKLCDNKYKNCITLFQHKWFVCVCVRVRQMKKTHFGFPLNKMLEEWKKERKETRMRNNITSKERCKKVCIEFIWETTSYKFKSISEKRDAEFGLLFYSVHGFIYKKENVALHSCTHSSQLMQPKHEWSTKRNRIKYFTVATENECIALTASRCHRWISERSVCPNAYYCCHLRFSDIYTPKMSIGQTHARISQMALQHCGTGNSKRPRLEILDFDKNYAMKIWKQNENPLKMLYNKACHSHPRQICIPLDLLDVHWMKKIQFTPATDASSLLSWCSRASHAIEMKYASASATNKMPSPNASQCNNRRSTIS